MSEVSTNVPEPPLSDQSVTFLNQELDRMQTLYLDAMSNAQNVFNFYLTFVSTVVGAIVVLIQIAPGGSADPLQTQLVIAGVLLFAAIVGTVYLSSLSGKYGHAARFAHGIDEIRRYLIDQLHVTTPPLYSRFMDIKGLSPEQTPDKVSWIAWPMPTGTYEFFIALMNSSALAGLTWLISAGVGVDLGRRIAAAVIVFVLVLTVNNIYSRMTIERFVRRFHIRIDMGSELVLWAARE